MAGAQEPLVYCLTRDRELAAALDERLTASLAFFYNDAPGSTRRSSFVRPSWWSSTPAPSAPSSETRGWDRW